MKTLSVQILLTAGNMVRPLDLGTKTVATYIYENIQKPYEKFDGVKQELTVSRLFD